MLGLIRIFSEEADQEMPTPVNEHELDDCYSLLSLREQCQMYTIVNILLNTIDYNTISNYEFFPWKNRDCEEMYVVHFHNSRFV